jgi:hypothetical protein
MPMFKVTMVDTVTYERVFTIKKQFRSLKAAEAWAEEHIDDPDAYDEDQEDQIDNTPWETEVEPIEAPPKPRKAARLACGGPSNGEV